MKLSHRGASSTITLPILKMAQSTTTKYFERFDTRLSTNVSVAKKYSEFSEAHIPRTHESAIRKLQEVQTLQGAAIAALSGFAVALNQAADFLEGTAEVPNLDFAQHLIEVAANGTDVQRTTLAQTLRQSAQVIEVELAAATNNQKRVKSAIAVCETESQAAMDAVRIELKEKSAALELKAAEKRLQDGLARRIAQKEMRAKQFAGNAQTEERLKSFYRDELPLLESEIESELNTLKLKQAFNAMAADEVAQKSYAEYQAAKARHQKAFYNKKGVK